ncbi:MAG: outer membrane beta-barrel protein [Bacteroidetes bacterium]|nr:outer membrane beta-barrel protein [Bacteroidota bacterium]
MRFHYKTGTLKSCLLFILLSISAIINAAIIKGRVLDGDTHEFIPNVAVSILETKITVVTDLNGNYSFKNLKPGTYTIIAKCMGYEKSIPQKLIIKDENFSTNYDIYLKPSIKHLNEVLVKKTRNKETDISARYDEKVAPNVMNIISAKAIEMLPDQNVADVMQRVSGVSMLKNSSGNNTRVIIRGMPPRYNTGLINGVELPRAASLDMIGSELVGRIEVIKASTPDIDGDGLGGTINIVMKQAPDKPFFTLNASTGYNQYYFNHDFLTFDSKAVSKKDFNQTKGPDYVPAISDFSRKNLIIEHKKAIPDMNGSIAFGQNLFNKKLGIIGVASIQNSELASTNINNSYSSDPYNNLQPSNLQNSTYCKEQKRYGGYVKVNYNINNNHQISFYNSYFKLHEIRARVVVDTSLENIRTVPGTGTVKMSSQTITDNSSIESAVMSGKHKLFENLDVDWSVAYTISNSDSPDYGTVNLTQNIPVPNIKTPIYLNYSGGIDRVWQWDTDQTKSVNLNINYKPTLFNHLFEFKVGTSGRMKFIKHYANEYKFDAAPNNDQYPNPDILTVPLTTKSDQQSKGNAIYNPGNFRAWEDIQAGYAMVKTTFGKLSILTGMRVEFTYMTNEHNQLDPQMPVAHARFAYYDLLPSMHLNYKFTKNQNLRLSFYQSINRPYPTEVIPYSDPRAGGQTGNDKLKHATGTCYDMRYEIYPNHEEVFTAGVFYKKIDNAIEELIQSGSESKRFQNVPLATNYGFELVAIKYFGNFGFSGNYTYTHSEIDVPKYFNVKDPITGNPISQTKREIRPLVGQSPHLINIGLSYHSAENGLKCNLVYTMQGSHVVNVSDAYGQDVYQKNFHNLGATFEKSISKKLVITAKVSNILNSPVEYETHNNFFIQKLKTYQTYFIGLKFNII